MTYVDGHPEAPSAPRGRGRHTTTPRGAGQVEIVVRAVAGDTPTWRPATDGALEPVALDALRVSPALTRDLAAWATEFVGCGERGARLARFEERGRRLAVRLDDELGTGTSVAYQGIRTPLPEPASILRVLGPDPQVAAPVPGVR